MIQVNRIYLIFNRLVTKKFLVDTSDMIIYMIGFGFSIGAQILIAQCNGNRQYKEVGKILSQGILFLLIIAAM